MTNLKFLLISLLFISNFSLATEKKYFSKILKCLGKEEATFHQEKKEGMYYKLNQLMISEMILLDEVDVKEEYLVLICNAKTSQALELLRALMFHEFETFSFHSTDPMKLRMNKSNTHEFLQKLPDIFATFLSLIQVNSPTPNCLNDKIPALAQLQQDIKYLLEDTPIKKILTPRRLLEIFRELEKVDSLFKICEKEKAEKEKKAQTKK